MAGESPGKSEQQKSSGETASSERDPRVAVRRGDGPVVDQPTAIFRALPRPASVAPTMTPEASAEAGEPADDLGGSDGSGGSAEASDGPVVPEDGAVDDGDAAVSGVASGKGDRDAESSRDGDARLRAAVAAWVADEAPTRTPDSGPVTEDTEDDRGVKGAANAVGARDAAGAGDAEAVAEAVEDVQGLAGARGAKDAAGAKGAEGTDGGTAPKGDDAPVDQPTAVFTAIPRKAVDQPTTALKAIAPRTEPAPAKPAPAPAAKPAPAKPAPAAKPVPAPASEPAPESPAERTSKFVPLRPDDVRPATKPAPAAGPRPAPASPAPEASQPRATAAATPASLTEPERTKQQPLPPRPPLDLLAELTNTPPPPETPVRTFVRRVKIWTPLVVLLAIVFAIVQLVRPLPAPTLALASSSTYTFEGGELKMPWPGEGQGAVEVDGVGVIGTYGEIKPAPIASVAKTMTAYVILKEHPITGKETGPKIEVDDIAEKEGSHADESKAAVKKGEKYTEKQMLQMLMIPSANNIARLLARWDSPSEAEFVKKMNATAKELGMTNTTYTDPSGLNSTTVSTAVDQLKLAKAAMKNDVFREIVNSPNATIPGSVGRMENNNTILLKPGVSGIKTGSSTPAGGNLLWAANTVVDGKERRIVGMVMGAQNAALLHDKLTLAIETYSYDLIKAAQDRVTSATVVKKGEVVGYVDDGLGGRTPVVATKDLRPVGWPGLKVDLELAAGGKTLPHAAKAGTVVGEISVGQGTGKAGVPVALQRDLVEPGVGDKLTRLG
ncbi:D-alanyl-D-alanine carboxypeptidase [Streptomyces sp. NPDC006368]|uniref:D-alanyl-D-alanine carboxypeptidase family protein n=1 Tax=Streptomyces sp. NPDC006368 TaxID=3156760 RepID=UPI0033A69982